MKNTLLTQLSQLLLLQERGNNLNNTENNSEYSKFQTHTKAAGKAWWVLGPVLIQIVSIFIRVFDWDGAVAQRQRQPVTKQQRREQPGSRPWWCCTGAPWFGLTRWISRPRCPACGCLSSDPDADSARNTALTVTDADAGRGELWTHWQSGTGRDPVRPDSRLGLAARVTTSD